MQSLARFRDVLAWSMASVALSGIALTGLSKARHYPATKRRGKPAASRQRSEIWRPTGSDGALQSVSRLSFGSILSIIARLLAFVARRRRHERTPWTHYSI